MSILLDALKKSESQRQLGTTPTLETPVFNQEAGLHPERSWVPLVMSLVAAVIIFWVGLAQFRQVDVVAGPSAITPEVMPQEAPLVTSAASADKTPAQRATTPVMDYQAAPPTVSPDTASPDSQKQLDQPAERPALTIQPFSITGQEEPEGKSPVTGVQGELRPVGPDQPATVSGQSPLAAEPMSRPRSVRSPVPEQEASGVSRSPVTAERLEPYVAEPISYWQIPQSVRDSMGELRVSVLVYADDPQERFLLINGQRLREQEELSDGLTLLEIQRDRAIFSYRNYRFQLKS